MDENERLTAKYQEMGEDEVRSKLSQGIISGRAIVPATEYLRQIDAERERVERVAAAEAHAEQTELARSAATSAADAANAAREQATAARDANDLAAKANTIATLALIAAVIAIAISIVAAFLA